MQPEVMVGKAEDWFLVEPNFCLPGNQAGSRETGPVEESKQE